MLLLDLDGVVVYEAEPPLVAARTLLGLHEDIEAALRRLGMPVVVLTHRSRREAAIILRSVGIAADTLAGTITAEDLLYRAVRGGHFARLARRGLAKSFALPHVERVFGIARQNIAFIDDKLHNLTDMLTHGVGLALHAPSEVQADGQGLVTFDLAAAVTALRQWQADATGAGQIVQLPPQARPIASWQPGGLHTGAVESHMFNRLRRAAFQVRRAVFRPRLVR